MDYNDLGTKKLRPTSLVNQLKSEVNKRLAPFAVRRSTLNGAEFEFSGRSYAYMVHPYNNTWLNERAVELPVALDFLARHDGLGMEFGNVLGHYGATRARTIVDKYETADGVENVDIIDYRPSLPLDFIIAVSTLEHVGWDERPRDPMKAIRAFDHLRSLLAPDGRMLITAPLGHNPTLDDAIASGLPVIREATLVREDGLWRQTKERTWRPFQTKGRRTANAVWIAEVSAAG